MIIFSTFKLIPNLIYVAAADDNKNQSAEGSRRAADITFIAITAIGSS